MLLLCPVPALSKVLESVAEAEGKETDSSEEKPGTKPAAKEEVETPELRVTASYYYISHYNCVNPYFRTFGF